MPHMTLRPRHRDVADERVSCLRHNRFGTLLPLLSDHAARAATEATRATTVDAEELASRKKVRDNKTKALFSVDELKAAQLTLRAKHGGEVGLVLPEPTDEGKGTGKNGNLVKLDYARDLAQLRSVVFTKHPPVNAPSTPAKTWEAVREGLLEYPLLGLEAGNFVPSFELESFSLASIVASAPAAAGAAGAEEDTMEEEGDMVDRTLAQALAATAASDHGAGADAGGDDSGDDNSEAAMELESALDAIMQATSAGGGLAAEIGMRSNAKRTRFNT